MGFHFAQLIREHPRYQQTALIFISSEPLTYRDQLKGYAYGLVDYLTAPVMPELLRAKVRVFADLYRTTAALHQEVAEHQRLEREAQRALGESHALREFLETTLASIGDAVMTTDAAGRLTFANATAQSMLALACRGDDPASHSRRCFGLSTNTAAPPWRAPSRRSCGGDRGGPGQPHDARGTGWHRNSHR